MIYSLNGLRLDTFRIEVRDMRPQFNFHHVTVWWVSPDSQAVWSFSMQRVRTIALQHWFTWSKERQDQAVFSLIMQALEHEAGEFFSSGVRVFDQHKLIQAGPLPTKYPIEDVP